MANLMAPLGPQAPPALSGEHLRPLLLPAPGEDNVGPAGFGLNDRRAIAELLLMRESEAARRRPTNDANNKSNDAAAQLAHARRDNPRALRGALRSFALGVELESQEALRMLAGVSPDDDDDDADKDDKNTAGETPGERAPGIQQRDSCWACPESDAMAQNQSDDC